MHTFPSSVHDAPSSSALTENLPNWDLSDFYNGLEDPKLQHEIDHLHALVDAFAAHAPTIQNRHDHLFDDLKDYEHILRTFSKISSFTYLYYATRMTCEKAQGYLQKIHEMDADISTKIMFFTLHIIGMDEHILEKSLKQDPRLETYREWFSRTRVYKDHILELAQEQILAQKDITASAAWVRLYDQTLAEMSFKDSKGETLNLSQIMERMSDKDSTLRKEAAELLSNELSSKKSLLTLIFNTVVKDKEVTDSLRQYQKPWTARHMANGIEEEVVDTLVETVRQNYALCHRYYAWKAKVFGVEKLQYWDRNAPLPNAPDDHCSWDEAKKIVMDAYAAFSPKIADIGKLFFDNNWIDVPPYPGKTSGAFAHPTTPDVHPYLMLNFVGKRRDVMTLAHELGHGIHQYLANSQPYLLVGTPLTVAETASVFGEMLTFQSMLKNANTTLEKQILLSGKIDDMMNTVFRQIAFHLFEVSLHTERKKGELTASALANIWQRTQEEALGSSVIVDPITHNFWGYISHFMHAPFYVYAYAFGDCLVNSLYSLYQSNSIENFEDKYINLLRSGGSQSYDQLLQPFGLNPKNPTFWQGGLNILKGFVEDLESL